MENKINSKKMNEINAHAGSVPLLDFLPPKIRVVENKPQSILCLSGGGAETDPSYEYEDGGDI